ncbi:transposase [Nonomuraea helvata]|uniref:Transposase n=1 Tax=Nonomuraea helvata TaxID=37484 RepID=A0ABV5SLV2_9ACTN
MTTQPSDHRPAARKQAAFWGEAGGVANKLWSGSYFAGSVGGAPLSIMRQYIEQQNPPR